MKILLINPAHPLTAHVSATRAWRFAAELSAMGHQAILLCAAIDAASVTSATGINEHDWRHPYVLAPAEARAPKPIRLPPLLGKAASAWYFVRDGGPMGHWVRSAVAAVDRISGWFHPDVIWTTFGRMEALVAARRIARRLGCPWVLDIKDNWELYVPLGFRRLMVLRTLGWAELTSNASFTCEKAKMWQQAPAKVIYSGVDDAFFGFTGITDTLTFRINLVGSLYFDDQVEVFIKGVHDWLQRVPSSEQSRIELCYIGAETDRFNACAAQCASFLRLRCKPYIAIDEFALECRKAAVNAYIAHPGTFHHKLLELLACGRPVLAVPRESNESRHLALSIGAELNEACDPSEVAKRLEYLHHRWRAGNDSLCAPVCASYAWPAQARLLAEVLARAASGRLNQS